MIYITGAWTNFQILNFNVERQIKTGEPRFFKNFIQKYDIVILSEAWKANT